MSEQETLQTDRLHYLTPCAECGDPTPLRCPECSAYTCWRHRHNFGTHHPAEFAVGQVVDLNGARFRIERAYANHARWMYDGTILPDATCSRNVPAIGVRVSAGLRAIEVVR